MKDWRLLYIIIPPTL